MNPESRLIKNQYTAIIVCFFIFIISFFVGYKKFKTSDIYYNQISPNLLKTDLDLLEEYLDLTYAGQFILKNEYDTLKKRHIDLQKYT